MPTKHPLGEAIDAGRWDAEAPLGRVVIVAHAAFLHAGFVSCGKPGPHRLPREVGLTASTLSLRYTIPELITRSRNAADAAVLRLCAHGNFLILYAYLTGDGSRPSTVWACVDALLVAPVLAGDMDATAHALANHALGVRLWAALAGGMCRRLFDDIHRNNGILLPPLFMLLPADLKAAILNRVADVDLAMVECTCTELRDLIAGRELWKTKYMAERRLLLRFEKLEVDGLSYGWSWKEMYRYLRARQSWPWRRPVSRHRLRPLDDVLSTWYVFTGSYALYFARSDLDRCKRQDPTENLIRRVRERRSNVPVSDGRRKPPVGDGDAGKRQCRNGVIHSPSARYKWRHR
ncbi:hypothetical protein EJB05_35335, partial [Eragrostis curvula]